MPKAAKDDITPDKGNLQLDFGNGAIAIKNNTDTRSGHGGGRAVHRQLLKEKADKTSPKENPWKQYNYHHPPFKATPPLNYPSDSPVLRLPAPSPPLAAN